LDCQVFLTVLCLGSKTTASWLPWLDDSASKQNRLLLAVDQPIAKKRSSNATPIPKSMPLPPVSLIPKSIDNYARRV
jgi:hypothetical protein